MYSIANNTPLNDLYPIFTCDIQYITTYKIQFMYASEKYSNVKQAFIVVTHLLWLNLKCVSIGIYNHNRKSVRYTIRILEIVNRIFMCIGVI